MRTLQQIVADAQEARRRSEEERARLVAELDAFLREPARVALHERFEEWLLQNRP
jgi:hypothetical protein